MATKPLPDLPAEDEPGPSPQTESEAIDQPRTSTPLTTEMLNQLEQSTMPAPRYAPSEASNAETIRRSVDNGDMETEYGDTEDEDTEDEDTGNVDTGNEDNIAVPYVPLDSNNAQDTLPPHVNFVGNLAHALSSLVISQEDTTTDAPPVSFLDAQDQDLKRLHALIKEGCEKLNSEIDEPITVEELEGFRETIQKMIDDVDTRCEWRLLCCLNDFNKPEPSELQMEQAWDEFKFGYCELDQYLVHFSAPNVHMLIRAARYDRLHIQYGYLRAFILQYVHRWGVLFPDDDDDDGNHDPFAARPDMQTAQVTALDALQHAQVAVGRRGAHDAHHLHVVTVDRASGSMVGSRNAAYNLLVAILPTIRTRLTLQIMVLDVAQNRLETMAVTSKRDLYMEVFGKLISELGRVVKTVDKLAKLYPKGVMRVEPSPLLPLIRAMQLFGKVAEGVRNWIYERDEGVM